MGERKIPGASTMKLNELVAALPQFDDFQAERVSGRQIERDLEAYNNEHQTSHRILMVPKFHCELNWIERKWAFIKQAIKAHTTGAMPGLVSAYKKATPTLSVQTCRRFARKARDYIRACIDGVGE